MSLQPKRAQKSPEREKLELPATSDPTICVFAYRGDIDKIKASRTRVEHIKIYQIGHNDVRQQRRR